jgi:16S rRNA (guanine1516-N2)-methyltransferase
MEIVFAPEDRALLQEILEGCERVSPSDSDFYLSFEAGVLRLCRHGDSRGIWVEEREIEQRLNGPFLLGRACGLERGSRLQILDATAGLGIDGLALSRRGAVVHLVERDPVLWALLKDLLRRLREPDVELTLNDSKRLLEEEGDYDVVYLDPMFPHRRKSALPGKRMQYLGALLDQSAPFDMDVLPLAQSRARSRVVLKRRLKDPVEMPPDWTLRGRTVRYDVYRGLA